MKCYYCDTEFQGYKCPKCLAVYTVDEKENESGIAAEEVHKKAIHEESIAEEDTINAAKERLETQGKSKAKKGKALEVVGDMALEIVGAIIENLFD